MYFYTGSCNFRPCYIISVFYETTCWPHGLNKQILDSNLPARNHLASETNSSRNNASSRFKRQIAIDKSSVVERFYTNGRVSFQCRSEHPDCFSRRSSSFGQCQSIVNSKKVVIGCRCSLKENIFIIKILPKSNVIILVKISWNLWDWNCKFTVEIKYNLQFQNVVNVEISHDTQDWPKIQLKLWFVSRKILILGHSFNKNSTLCLVIQQT